MNKKIKFDSMVICSTLNQMVNYIAIKEHDININNIYNIRLEEGNDKFNYDKWDRNLEGVLGGKLHSGKIIQYSDDEILDHENIIDRLIEEFGGKNSYDEIYPLKKEKILWNITGGQRHFVMAITEYVYNERPQDVIVYFEGDNEKMYYYTKNNEIKDEDIYKKEEYKITIPIALRLMGFEVSDKELNESSKYYNFLISDSKEEFLKVYELQNKNKIDGKDVRDVYKQLDEQHKWYGEFYNTYCNSEILRKLFINSNKFKGNNDITVFDKIKEDIEEHIKDNLIIDNKNIISDILNEEGFKILKESIREHTNGKVFGYILEKMTFYKVLSVLKNNKRLMKEIADIDISVKIKGGTDDKDNLGVIDEFDILLVTKKGKVIMFECKSGSMSGDNAKSHNYSTYAIAGVYGEPTLICPTVKDEDGFTNKKEFETKVKNQLGEKECEKNKDVYQYIKSARNAAIKAGLDICYVNTIGEKIKELINVMEEE